LKRTIQNNRPGGYEKNKGIIMAGGVKRTGGSLVLALRKAGDFSNKNRQKETARKKVKASKPERAW
jgi:hypothetical protein